MTDNSKIAQKVEKDLDDLLLVQKQNLTDPYMIGLYNGMLLAKSLFGHEYYPVNCPRDAKITHLTEQVEELTKKFALTGAVGDNAFPLHENSCPYKPFEHTPGWEEVPDGIECTCPEIGKGRYWKIEWMLARGKRDEKITHLNELLKLAEGALEKGHKAIDYLWADRIEKEREYYPSKCPTFPLMEEVNNALVKLRKEMGK